MPGTIAPEDAVPGFGELIDADFFTLWFVAPWAILLLRGTICLVPAGVFFWGRSPAVGRRSALITFFVEVKSIVFIYDFLGK